MDGRTSRLAFADPEKLSQLTGVPMDLIRDFDALIVALVSGADINPIQFEGLANSWLDRFHSNPNISWNVLSPTVRSYFCSFILVCPSLMFHTYSCLQIGSSCSSSWKVKKYKCN